MYFFCSLHQHLCHGRIRWKFRDMDDNPGLVDASNPNFSDRDHPDSFVEMGMDRRNPVFYPVNCIPYLRLGQIWLEGLFIHIGSIAFTGFTFYLRVGLSERNQGKKLTGILIWVSLIYQTQNFLTKEIASEHSHKFKTMESNNMIEYVHKHIISELNQNSRTDIIFILSAIILNLIMLAINSGLIENSRTNDSYLIVMFIFVALILLINVVAIFGLLKGKELRGKLLSGLLVMYKDKQIDKYYDPSLLGNYNTRYNLFIMVVVFTGMISVVVPFVIR